MSSSLSLTSQQIIDHRASRKAAGLTGCISGRPEPAINFFGFSDVQSWRPADPMNPHCFCFDCRDLWDRDGSIDLQLVLDGNTFARETYMELLPADLATSTSTSSELGRLMAEHVSPPAFGLPSHIDTAQPTYHSFDEIPMSLPTPRKRDILNETPEERLNADLAILRGKLRTELVVVMDSRRQAVCYENDDEALAFLASVREQETILWKKIDAIDLLLLL